MGEHSEFTPWYLSGSVEKSFNSLSMTHLNVEVDASKLFTGHGNSVRFLVFLTPIICSLQSLQGLLILTSRYIRHFPHLILVCPGQTMGK